MRLLRYLRNANRVIGRPVTSNHLRCLNPETEEAVSDEERAMVSLGKLPKKGSVCFYADLWPTNSEANNFSLFSMARSGSAVRSEEYLTVIPMARAYFLRQRPFDTRRLRPLAEGGFSGLVLSG
jgi:hypothetical protein